MQTIFDGGKLSGQKDLVAATEKVLIANYRQSVIGAYSDVETALQQIANNTKAKNHLLREIIAAGEAFKIAKLQYQQGATDLLTVLQAQQTLFSAEDQLAQATQDCLQASVHLYQGVGRRLVGKPGSQDAGALIDCLLAKSTQVAERRQNGTQEHSQITGEEGCSVRTWASIDN